jgi:Zn-dependent peptidase ImmA (M78 family)
MSIHTARAQADFLTKQFQCDTPPIDVERIASELGLAIVRANLGDDVSGMLVTNKGRSFVCVHERHHIVRQRFTIAHEIGHHVLGHQFESGDHVHIDHGNFISQRGPRASTGLDPKEIEANQFAAALLMPVALVRKAAIEVAAKSALLDFHVERLADRFCVSQQAMTIRLSTLGLL